MPCSDTLSSANFIAFLKELGVETAPTEMTFGICRDEGAFEWSGTSLDSIFAQRKNILRPKFWRMIFDIVRFNLFALDVLTKVDGTLANKDEQSIGEYLERENYSAAFRDDYLIPMTACVWSTGADKCGLEFPAVTLIRFMWNHHLLSTITKRPDWLTIPGGSKKYIDAVMNDFPQTRVHLSTPVKTLKNGKDGKVIMSSENGQEGTFDDVILACHGDEAMDIIAPFATAKEREIMGSFHTTPNKVYLHSDLSVSSLSSPLHHQTNVTQLMPRRRKTWSSWNYLTSSNPQPTQKSPSDALQTVSLTYNMNILQHISPATFSDVLVTMNPPHPPKPSTVQYQTTYTHPLYNAAAVRAQSRLDEIQGVRGVWYCGAWCGYGFHEDGFEAGLKVAEALGGGVKWRRESAKFVRGRVPRLRLRDSAARFVVAWIQWGILWVERVWALLMGIGKEKGVKLL